MVFNIGAYIISIGGYKLILTSSSTGLRNIGTFAAKTRSKGANITPHGELGVMQCKS